jgi:acyl-CoA synthetase (NDP forming)/GNAT superfamily N-acetyltransferase
MTEPAGGPAAQTRAAASAPVYALLADGTTVEIRPATPADHDAVRDMHAAMSPDNAYLRFFNVSPLAAEREAQRVCREGGDDHAALLAWLRGELIGVASYEVAGTPGTAEIAFAVADHMHHRGVATLLLEHLVSLARSRHIRQFTAETLAENSLMLRVFTDAGLPVQRRRREGVVELTFPLPASEAGEAGQQLDAYLDRVAGRERHANVESMRALFQPASVVVVGTSRRPGSVGRAILRNILTGGYQERVYAVNPHARHIEGVTCAVSVTALPEPPDLAVVAVPPAAVPSVAEECGRRGVRGLVVITAGLDESQGADLLATCRRHGMRLVGPNCFGVAVPASGLDATFAARHPEAGTAGLVMQSGGLGFTLAGHLSRLGIGISSFASVGNKLDVSSNDMLMWWEQDGITRLAVLYIESFGHPRKFARTARRVGRSIPVLTVHAGRSEAGQHAAASHTAAAATPLVSREALFQQAGIIATRDLGELLNTAALLATQPVPAGHRVAVVSNVGGAGVLAADACAEAGLVVHRTGTAAQRRLRAIVPPGGAVTGPVDTSATVSRADFRRCLEIAAADGATDSRTAPDADGRAGRTVDAVLALVLPTAATGDLVAAVREADVHVPMAAVVLDQAETVRLLPRDPAAEQCSDGSGSLVPVYSYPESAAWALSRAASYGAWRSRPRGLVPDFGDLRTDNARELVSRFLASRPDGGWLPPDQVAELLGGYGIPLVATGAADSEEEAVRLAHEAGGPVVLKADVPGLVHKTDAGAVELDLQTADDVREGYRHLAKLFGSRLRRVLIQPMITDGTEVIIGVASDPMFGPLVLFGLGGVATEVLADHAARLTPLTDTDADELIRSVRSAPLLLGHRSSPRADITALRGILLRVSRLADDVPELADLDLNPVIARPDGVFAVDARIRMAPAEPRDPFLRRLG